MKKISATLSEILTGILLLCILLALMLS